MKIRSTFLNIIRNKLSATLIILFFTFFAVLASYPGKSCEKQDTLKIEAKKAAPVETTIDPDKNKPKEECKKFNMMSLNLVYFLMNKFINTSFDKK